MAFLQIIFGRYLLLVGIRHVFALTHLNFSNSKSRKFITVIAHVPQRVTPVRASHIRQNTVRSRGICNGGWRPAVVFFQFSNVLQVDRNFATAEPSALRFSCSIRIGLCTPNMITRERYRNEDRLMGL